MKDERKNKVATSAIAARAIADVFLGYRKGRLQQQK